MATTETARLERETEETRARLEQTLGELRARISPSQLMDQATDYFRNSSGRAFAGNLRDEIVHNPMPVALIGAGIAWLAISGTMGRRANGNGRADMARDWGRTAGIADDLGHGGSGPSAMRRARQTAEGLAGAARDTVSGAGESWREGASGMGERASTAYDETIGRARETAEGWTDEARSAAQQAGEAWHEGMEGVRESASHMRERAGDIYQQTSGGVRRAARKAADYGRAARHAVQSDGALVNFCREQPLLVAGIGVAFGAALAAMIPASRAERQVMGDASRDVQDRVRGMASETFRTGDSGNRGENQSQSQSGDGDGESLYGSQRPSWQGESARSDSAQSGTRRQESWQAEPAREAAAGFERGMQQGDRASNIETEPQSAPYAEAAEAGAAGATPVPGEDPKQRT